MLLARPTDRHETPLHRHMPRQSQYVEVTAGCLPVSTAGYRVWVIVSYAFTGEPELVHRLVNPRPISPVIGAGHWSPGSQDLPVYVGQLVVHFAGGGSEARTAFWAQAQQDLHAFGPDLAATIVGMVRTAAEEAMQANLRYRRTFWRFDTHDAYERFCRILCQRALIHYNMDEID